MIERKYCTKCNSYIQVEIPGVELPRWMGLFGDSKMKKCFHCGGLLQNNLDDWEKKILDNSYFWDKPRVLRTEISAIEKIIILSEKNNFPGFLDYVCNQINVRREDVCKWFEYKKNRPTELREFWIKKPQTELEILENETFKQCIIHGYEIGEVTQDDYESYTKMFNDGKINELKYVHIMGLWFYSNFMQKYKNNMNVRKILTDEIKPYFNMYDKMKNWSNVEIMFGIDNVEREKKEEKNLANLKGHYSGLAFVRSYLLDERKIYYNYSNINYQQYVEISKKYPGYGIIPIKNSSLF